MKHEKVVSLGSKRVIRFAELVLGPNPVERLLPGTLEQWARLLATHSVTDAEVESLGRWRSLLRRGVADSPRVPRVSDLPAHAWRDAGPPSAAKSC